MGPMLHLFIFVADLCYLIFPNFLAYFGIFLSLENDTGADFWTQPRGVQRLSLNMPANQRVTSSQSDLSFLAPFRHLFRPIAGRKSAHKGHNPPKPLTIEQFWLW